MSSPKANVRSANTICLAAPCSERVRRLTCCAMLNVFRSIAIFPAPLKPGVYLQDQQPIDNVYHTVFVNIGRQAYRQAVPEPGVEQQYQQRV
jgi:hypothetical protein